MTLSLQEIVIVGSACEQAKFSELTMDMFRMLQTLEREPMEGTHPMTILGGGMLPMIGGGGGGGGGHGGPLDASPAAGRMPYGAQTGGSKAFMENGVGGVGGASSGGMGGRPYRDNPHKYLLYKPSISQLLVFLASGFKELPPGGALLLYMSADGCFSTTQHPEDCEYHA